MTDYSMVFPPPSIFLGFLGEPDEDEGAESDPAFALQRINLKPSVPDLSRSVRFPIQGEIVSFEVRGKMPFSNPWNHSLRYSKTDKGNLVFNRPGRLLDFDMQIPLIPGSCKRLPCIMQCGRKVNITGRFGAMQTNMKADPEIARAIVEDLKRFGALPAHHWTEAGFPELPVLSSLLDLESKGTIRLQPGTGLWSLNRG